MKTKKVGRLILSMNSEERAHFGRWLAAELGDRQQYIQRLFVALTPREKSLPDEREVWQALYPQTAYDDARLRKLSSDLAGWLEEFLAIEAFRRDRFKLGVYLLGEINRRCPELFSKLFRRLHKAWQQQPLRNAQHFRLRYELERERQMHQSLYKSFRTADGSKQAVSPEAFPSQLNQFFDCWWMTERLALGSMHASQHQRTGNAIKDPMETHLIQFLEAHPHYLQAPALRIYRDVLLKLKRQSSLDVQALVHDIKANEQQLDAPQLNALCTLLLNFFIRQLNESGNPALRPQLRKLYEWAIQDELIFPNGMLSSSHYKNLITICLKDHAPQQAWHYLHTLKPRLPTSQREEAFTFNLGHYHFMTGNLVAVIACFQRQAFTNVFYEINARMLLLQAHYEHGRMEPEWLYEQATALARFIRQQPLSAYHQQAYLQRLKYFKRLLRATHLPQLQRLLTDVQQAHSLDQREWLLDQVQRRLSR